MTKPFLSLTVAIFVHCTSMAQSTLIQGTRIRDKKLYLKVENGELKSFVRANNEAGNEPFDETAKFAMDSKNCNVYVQWMNPLRYQLKWADSTFDNESDAAVQSYITQLVALFGSPVSTLNQDNSNSKAAINNLHLAPKSGANELHYPPDGFKSLKLTFLYLQLRQSNPPLDSSDIAHLNAIETNITKLDLLNGENIAAIADEQFKKLFNIKTAQELADKLPGIKEEIAGVEENTFKLIEGAAKGISEALGTLTLSNKLLEGYYKATIIDFVNEALKNLAANWELIKKLNPVIELMDASDEIPGDVQLQNTANPGTKTEYYKNRDIKLANGKALHTAVSLVEKEYKEGSHEYTIKSETKKGEMQFREYDPVTVFVSAGGFFANTKLRSYGVDQDMKVTESEIEKDNFVAAAFLNFNFVPSRYISPLLQIGIDPTKKHPFMLLGGGFSIPVARIALSAGGVWTWDASLKDLEIGKTIESTTDLDKDISYKFSMQPKGWYLGIQYNF